MTRYITTEDLKPIDSIDTVEAYGCQIDEDAEAEKEEKARIRAMYAEPKPRHTDASKHHRTQFR